jgi:hypothetical protein
MDWTVTVSADMDAFKNFNLENWWNPLAVAGLAIVLTSIGFRYFPGVLMGLGLLFVAVGEIANHPKKDVKRTVEGLQGFRIVSAYDRAPQPIGWAFDGLGTVLFIVGLFAARSS